ncbi:AsmA family protein [Jannaschia sp. W003]|uniref:AsmA family protein n=1 Tax=Jannaschia sp. W003 TaxID=2867012 RepID=UPI0021A38E49|nr:AsmA family protein [Jannaschia sp. W003]UWQ22569.1 AsmA family protein [Jannaschia sp. W003]
MVLLLRLLALPIALVLLLAGAAMLVPAERLARHAAGAVEAATGLAVAWTGPVRLAAWPPGLELRDVRAEGPGAAADVARVGLAIDPAALLRGELRLARVHLAGARAVVRDGGGLAALQAAARLDRLEVAGATLEVDGAHGTARFRAVELDLRRDGRGTRFEASALTREGAVVAGGRTDDLAALLGGALQPVTLSLRAGGTALTLDGRAGVAPLAFDGTLDLFTDDRLAGLGLPRTAPPEGFGRRRAALVAAATLAPDGALHLRGLDLALDGNRFTGEADLRLEGARPRLVARLEAPSLDLDAFSRRGGGGRSLLVSERGWARRPFQASVLEAADLDVALRTGPVSLGAATVDAARLRLSAEGGTALLRAEELRLYGGTAAGTLRLAPAARGVAVELAADLRGVAAGPMLADWAGVTAFDAPLDARAALAGGGADAAALVADLAGTLEARFATGALHGADLPEMAVTGRAVAGGATPVHGADTRWRVDGGTMSGDVGLRGPRRSFRGGGTVDLAARRVDLRLVPEGGGAAIAVAGPWRAPRVAPEAPPPAAVPQPVPAPDPAGVASDAPVVPAAARDVELMRAD